jgi:GcrA cell cycle regulator
VSAPRAAWASEAGLAKLRVYWNADVPTAEIGRRLGASKSAIVGKAQRLGLPRKPSPIRRNGAGLSEIPRAARQTLAALASLDTLSPIVEAPPVVAAYPVISAPIPAPPPAPFVRSRTAICCWPIGEPGTKTFRFCDDTSVPGKPYCDEHARLAFVKIRDRRGADGEPAHPSGGYD